MKRNININYKHGCYWLSSNPIFGEYNKYEEVIVFIVI